MGILGRVVSCLTFALLALCAERAWALDSSQPTVNPNVPLKVFSSPQAALEQGMRSYRAGNMKSSVEALTYAAANGHPLAQWKLGRMYADGEGVPRNDLKAYDYFSQIIENYDEDTADDKEVSVVANAYVNLGIYALNGIANSDIKPDAKRALDLFQYSAVNFGNPNAQYNLARMYLEGKGTDRDGRQAARWLNLAADKNHRQSQALLGHLLFTGQGVPQQRAKGLMWLTLARDASDGPQDAWIIDLYNKDAAVASDEDKQAALMFLEDQINKRN